MAEQIYGYKENGTKILATTKEEFTELENDVKVAQSDIATAEAGISNLTTNLNSLTNTVSTLNSNTTTALNGKQKAITRGTATPSGGSDGDIYIQYF